MVELRDDGGIPIVNFGGNVSFTPRHRYAPRSEGEVLEVLERHAGGTIRVVGSLHSWSDDTVCDDVIVDMRYFARIAIETRDGETWATVGAGCVLADVLAGLRSEGLTLPTIGAVTVQRMAGVVSTATHGSGHSSFSHYISALRVAAYDPQSGKPKVFEFESGDELRAARCAIGALGIIVEVRFRCVPTYCVAQTLVRRATLDEVVADVARFPLLQFVLVPYLWAYIVFQRSEVGSERSVRPSWWRVIHRFYAFVGIDVLLHVLVKLLVTAGRAGWIRWFFRSMFVHLAWLNRTVIDRSERILTLHHELFKHVEMELFVPASGLADAVAVVRTVIARFDGGAVDADPGVETALARIGMLDELRGRAGSYTHHYPIFFRRVLPDDTLISMTAGATEPYYTISLFCYREPREPFYVLADFLARALNRLHRACPHWGKYFPLDYADIDPQYPRFDEFRAICRRYDGRGTFRNSYATRVLGFDREDADDVDGRQDVPRLRAGRAARRS